MSGTVGLGGGVKTDFGIHAVDGARLGGIWGIRGINYISDHMDAVAKWTEEAIDEVQKNIDDYMEKKKLAVSVECWLVQLISLGMICSATGGNESID